jgi:hypothetical protein
MSYLEKLRSVNQLSYKSLSKIVIKGRTTVKPKVAPAPTNFLKENQVYILVRLL